MIIICYSKSHVCLELLNLIFILSDYVYVHITSTMILVEQGAYTCHHVLCS